jgi:ubiquinone/menaquinone biosynthesis C-methylase UbiE
METTNYNKHINSNPIQKKLIDNFYNQVYKLLKPLKLDSILDVGCGEGITLFNFEKEGIGKKLYGIDYSDDALKIGKKIHPHLNLRKGDIYDIEEKDGSFDLVMATEVLEHLDNPEKALQELIRVSKKYVMLSVPNEPFFIGANFIRGKYLKNFGNHPEHINHWTLFSFRKFLQKNNLTIVAQKHPFAWTLILAKKK